MAYVIILDDDFANVYHREKDENLTFVESHPIGQIFLEGLQEYYGAEIYKKYKWD